METKMTPKEYMETQFRLVELSKHIMRLDLPAFLEQIAQSEVEAPTRNPELYEKAKPNLEATKELALAFVNVREKFGLLQQAVISTSMSLLKKE
jgi:hypothetical protein